MAFVSTNLNIPDSRSVQRINRTRRLLHRWRTASAVAVIGCSCSPSPIGDAGWRPLDEPSRSCSVDIDIVVGDGESAVARKLDGEVTGEVNKHPDGSSSSDVGKSIGVRDEVRWSSARRQDFMPQSGEQKTSSELRYTASLTFTNQGASIADDVHRKEIQLNYST